jgi:uncharacterized iron-regulated membrane protein
MRIFLIEVSMNSRKIKTWAWVHKWSSLVCTVFMLLLCLTGLPLIFHHEIGHMLGTEVEAPEMPAGTPRASLDRVLEVAKARHPDRVVQFASPGEDDDNLWFVTLTPTPAPTEDFKSVVVDARTAEVLGQPKFDEGFMYVMFKLHVDLFAGLPGKLFLGFMGLLLLVAIVSGTVLYAPFMRKLDFGTVRREKRPRLKWLDLHNLLGIVTLPGPTWSSSTGSTTSSARCSRPIRARRRCRRPSAARCSARWRRPRPACRTRNCRSSPFPARRTPARTTTPSSCAATSRSRRSCSSRCWWMRARRK